MAASVGETIAIEETRPADVEASHRFGVGLASSALQATARRRFNVSLIVAAAFPVLVGLRTASPSHETPPEMAA